MKSLNRFFFPELFLWVVSAGVIVLFFILNCFTPLITDDYGLSLGIHSVADIVRSQYNQWFTWGGRCVAHFFAQFWLLMGKPLFNMANTLVYCAFVFLTYFHITGTLRKFKPFLFLAINIFYWFLVPAWGENFLWLDGSCNYLWTTTIILFFLVPFRSRHDTKDYTLNTLLSVSFFFIGVLAGWSNENSGAAVLFLLAAYFTMKCIKKEKVCLFEITGAVGFLVGFIMLIGAPGNYVRAEVVREMGGGHGNDPLLIMLLKRFVTVTLMFFGNHGFTIMAAAAFLAVDLRCHQKRRLNLFSYFYALAALASAYSMILSPSFPNRAFLIVLVFSGITLANVLSHYDMHIPAIIKRNNVIVTFLILLAFFSSVLKSSKNIMSVYLRWQSRVEYILAEKQRGNMDVEVKAPIPAAPDRHVAFGEMSVDPTKWPNTAIAEYFGLNSIKGVDNGEPWKPLW